jgi:hypothetical protein
MKRSSTWLAPAVVVFVLACVAAAAAADRTERPTVILYVSDVAKVPRDVLERAEREMTAIYRRIGVNAVWADCFRNTAEPMSRPAPCNNGSLRLLVVIPSAAATEQMRLPQDVLGLAPRASPEVAGRVVYVFYDRAKALAHRSREFNVGTLFGYVLAHEIGHLLLPFGSHSPNGIMSRDWDNAQLRAADRGALSFTNDQAKLIRATVSAAQLRSQAAPSVAMR